MVRVSPESNLRLLQHRKFALASPCTLALEEFAGVLAKKQKSIEEVTIGGPTPPRGARQTPERGKLKKLGESCGDAEVSSESVVVLLP